MEVANQLAEEYCWVDDLEKHPILLVSGLPGSGKSSLVEWILNRRKERDSECDIEVCDPSVENGSWEGFSRFGHLLNYEEIDARLETFCVRVKTRYKEREMYPDCVFRPFIFVCDEFPRCGDKCSNVGDFLMTLKHIGKVQVSVILIGQSQVFPSSIQSIAATLELMSIPDSRHGMSRRKFKGLLKTPLDGEKKLVKIPPLR